MADDQNPFANDTGKSHPREEKPEPFSPSAKDLMTGRVLDGFIEGSRVKALDEFTPPPSKKGKTPLRVSLENRFTSLNPSVSIDLVDWNGYINESLNFQENLESFEKAYPGFKWIKELEENNPLVDQLKSDIETARYEGITDRQILDSLRKIGLRPSQPASATELRKARETIEELKNSLEEAKKQAIPKVAEPRPSPDQIEKLYDEFRLAIKSRLAREPKTAEYEKFTSCVEAAPTLSGAKAECTRLVEMFTPRKGVIIDVSNASILPDQPIAGASSPHQLPAWAQYLQNRLVQKQDEEKRKEERGPAQEASHLLAVMNSKTGKIQNVKFLSQEQMDSYIKMLPVFYEYTVLKGTTNYERSGFGKSKSRR